MTPAASAISASSRSWSPANWAMRRSSSASRSRARLSSASSVSRASAIRCRAAPRRASSSRKPGQCRGGERLQARGLGLSAGALGDFDQVGVEPPARLGECRLVLAPGDEAGERLLAADGGGEFAVAVRLARLALEAIDLGVDLLQYVLDADEIVVCAL